MPHFNEYKGGGITLAVRFTCRRCGRTQIENLEDMDKGSESYGYLHNLKKPEGWDNLHIHGPLLCPECNKAYDAFMQNEKEADQ